MIFDAPPAIIHPWPVHQIELYIGKERIGELPADFLTLPKALRSLVPVGQLRPYLPVEYRRLPDALLLQALGFGMPGVLMAGGIRKVWLYLASDTFTIPGDWNRGDNRIHALGRGGAGARGNRYTSDACAGGGGGGGGAWAWLINAALAINSSHLVNIPTTNGDTYFSANDYLMAKGGIDGSDRNGGSGGDSASSIGSAKYSGGAGVTKDVRFGYTTDSGGLGGGAGSPFGDATGSGGANAASNDPWDAKIDNVQSGNGGSAGFSTDPMYGSPGNDYGAGGGGGGVNGTTTGAGGASASGVILIINNFSL